MPDHLSFNSLHQKRQQFHNQIRRKDREQIRNKKRQILLSEFLKSQQNNQNNQNNKNSNIQDCRQKCLNLEGNLFALVNILALEKPFDRLDNSINNSNNNINNSNTNSNVISNSNINNTINSNTNSNSSIISSFCFQLTSTILQQTLPYLGNYPQRTYLRIYCLTALSNLFSDQLCQNYQHVKIVVESIDRMYGGIELWGTDDEIEEVYYMLSNVMRKNITYVGMLELEKLLKWCEDAIFQVKQDCLVYVLKGLSNFFRELEKTYNHQKKQLFMEHFKTARMLIIEKVIKRQSILLSIGNFIISLIDFYQSSQDFIYYNSNKKSKIITSLSSIQNEKQQVLVLNQQILTFHRVFLLVLFQQLSTTLCLQYLKIKLIILKLFHQILFFSCQTLKLYEKNSLFNAFKHFLHQKQLQNVLISVLNMGKDQQMYEVVKEVVLIYRIIVQASQGKLANRIGGKLYQIQESCIEIPQQIQEIIEEALIMEKEYRDLQQNKEIQI